ncbi:ETC complex I subunit conserved region-domain-containing protein [Tricladium varicosporioides]|nr:ETC complex I subunit conserved region-domain-containing protein [Hymenoscyphus varicosporioides]
MRRTFRQLAAVKPSRFLEAGAPTGLTGLYTHPSPRSALLYVYSQTLDKLAQFPESSLYRQSTEAVTKHRMNIVTAAVPEGYKDWLERVQLKMAENPEAFAEEKDVGGSNVSLKGKMTTEVHGGRTFVTGERESKEMEGEGEEWNGEAEVKGGIEVGTFMKYDEGGAKIDLPEEPKLTAAQIMEIENKIGMGLIEEVLQVAEGELKLADVMLRSKVWEDLEEKPVEGQWTYFMRDTKTPTQQPPQK